MSLGSLGLLFGRAILTFLQGMRRYSRLFHHPLYERQTKVRKRETGSCISMCHINGYTVGIGKSHLVDQDKLPNKLNLQKKAMKT